MSKRNTRNQMLYTLTFLFFLICAFAAFFTGVKVGADKTEAKYEKIQSAKGAEEFTGSYQQRDLVTFYHNVFLPYREFKREWNTQVDKLSRSKDSRINAAAIKNLANLADQQFDKVSEDSIFTNSPLLHQAQLNILKSLTLFSKSSNNISATADGAETAKLLRGDSFNVAAIKHGLLAQKNFYDSILKWGSKTNDKIPSETTESKTISFIQWKKMPLLLKNATIADMMLNRGIFASYDPQDITAKIDNMIYSGTASSLNITDVQSSFNLLISTGAVQEQDFVKWQDQYYTHETIPQLPFFIE